MQKYWQDTEGENWNRSETRVKHNDNNDDDDKDESQKRLIVSHQTLLQYTIIRNHVALSDSWLITQCQENK